MRQSQADKTMWTVRDVADYLNVCKTTVYRLIRTPGFPVLKVTSKAYRIPREALLRWLENEPGTRQMIEARVTQHTRTHSPEVPRLWEKAGNGSTPRARIRTPEHA